MLPVYHRAMSRMHPVIRLILAVVLSLTSVTLAVARTQMPGSTDVVICSGYGVVSVTLDAAGNPTGPVHACPDCLTGAATFLPPSAPLLRPATRAITIDLPAAFTGIAASLPAATARGPPPVI